MKPLMIVFSATFALSTQVAMARLKLETDTFRMVVAPDGVLQELVETHSRRNYLLHAPASHFAHVQMYGEKVRHPVTAVTTSGEGSEFTAALTFRNGVEATVAVRVTPVYITCELKALSDANVEYFLWGPYYSTIHQTVGGVVGVVRDETYALCLRNIDRNTVGGFPGDTLKTGGIQDRGMAVALSAKTEVLGPGSRLAAYAKNRSRTQVTDFGDGFGPVAHGIEGLTPVGSKVAIFGCPEPRVLDTLETMIKAEGLPYTTWKGVWTKRVREHTRPRLIIPYTEENVEQCIEIAKAGSFAIVYHKVPYESKGTFLPRKDHFPNGFEGLRRCADKIRAAGLEPGLHNLSAFTDFSDPIVSPVPHADLATCAHSTIGADIGPNDKTIPLTASALAAAYVVDLPAKTGKKQKTAPNIVRIGDELIRYSKTEGKDPITLVGCRRGYAGTKAAAHGKGDAVAKLLTHKRGVVFPNIRLLPEIAVNLGRSLKLTGIRSLSFDGLEGTDATGHGGYAQALFTYTVWKAVNDDKFIASSSRAGEYFWYLNSHQTWGEPHGKGFRHDKAYYEGKIAGRIERILVPNYIAFRLGQYKFRNLSRITDIEWLLTKCAALDGGFDLYITPEEYAAAGDFGKEVMATISLWEEARMQRVFTPEQRKVMGEFETVFRLTKDDTGKFAVIRLGPEEAKEVIDPVLGDPKTKDREKSVELYH